MSENVQTFSGKVNVADNLLVGTSHFFVDRQNNRVGIGTSTPDASSMLDVTGNIRAGGTITATGGFSGNGSGLSGVNSDSGSWVNGSSSNIHLAVSGDKVGIGVLDPGYKLDVNGDINISSGSTLRVGGTPAVFSNWSVNGSDIYRSSGNVGIGVTIPEVPFNVVGNNALSGNPNNAIASFRATTAVPGTNDAGVVIGSINGNTPYIADVSTASIGLSFYTQNAPRMRILANGNVGVGVTSPDGTLEISSTRTGLTALTNNEATLMISCTDTNAADDGDIGGGVVFRQRWINSSSSLVPTGGIYGYKDRNSGSYGGGLIFTYCPNNGSPDNLVEAMRITKEGSLRLTGEANHPIKKTAATASTATYNYILNCERPGTTSGGAVHFINGSGRSHDGGTSTYTMRNDSGNTRVGNSSYSTIIAGAHSFPNRPIALVGKNNSAQAGQNSGVFVFNTALINSGIYNYSNGRFTVPSGYGGYYLLSFTGLGAYYNTNAPNTRWYVNGSVHNYGAYHTNLGGMSGTPAHVGISGMNIINLAAGSYVDLRIVGGTLYGQSTLHAYTVCMYLGGA